MDRSTLKALITRFETKVRNLEIEMCTGTSTTARNRAEAELQEVRAELNKAVEKLTN